MPILCFSQDTTKINKLRFSHFSGAMELTSKYVWRGIEYGNAPTIFGILNYDIKGFNVFALGGYAFNGSHSEVDLGLSYTNKWFTVGASDYYYPSATGENDRYFNYENRDTGHSIECYFTFAYDKIPVWLTISAFVFGADKNLDNKQAYSSYLELGYSHNFTENNSLSLIVGASLNKSFYTGYKHGFNVVNVAAKYSTGILMGEFVLPISVSLVFNPYTNKPFLSLSIYLRS